MAWTKPTTKDDAAEAYYTARRALLSIPCKCSEVEGSVSINGITFGKKLCDRCEAKAAVEILMMYVAGSKNNDT